jgi:ADP-ribose pyrophosphatase YjhB (NUDIX family)
VSVAREFTEAPGRPFYTQALIYSSDKRRVLLVEQVFGEGRRVLGLPGGSADDRTPSHRACQQQCLTGTGLTVTPGKMLVVHEMLSEDGSVHEGVTFIFDGGPVEPDTAAIELGTGVLSHRWLTMDELTEQVEPYMAWRVRTAAAVRDGQYPLPCLTGHPPSIVTSAWRRNNSPG